MDAAHKGRLHERRFGLFWLHELAVVQLQHVLAAPNDGQGAVGLQLANVAGDEVAVLSVGLVGGFGVVKVAVRETPRG